MHIHPLNSRKGDDEENTESNVEIISSETFYILPADWVHIDLDVR